MTNGFFHHYQLGEFKCADPEGGPGVRTPSLEIKNFTLKKVISGFLEGWTPSSVTKNYHFCWTPSYENFWIHAWSTFIFRGVSLCKQNSPRWDAAFCGVTSGAMLFAYVPQKDNRHKRVKQTWKAKPCCCAARG